MSNISLKLKLDTSIIDFNINTNNEILELENIYEKFRLMGITDEYFGNICIIVNKQNFKKKIKIKIEEIDDTFIFICGEINKTNHINYLIKKYYSYLDSSINVNTNRSKLLYNLPGIDRRLENINFVQADNETDTNTEFSFCDEESEYSLSGEENSHTFDREETDYTLDKTETDNFNYNFFDKEESDKEESDKEEEDNLNKKLITKETIDKINSETIKLFEDEDFKYLIKTYLEYPDIINKFSSFISDYIVNLN